MSFAISAHTPIGSVYQEEPAANKKSAKLGSYVLPELRLTQKDLNELLPSIRVSDENGVGEFVGSIVRKTGSTTPSSPTTVTCQQTEEHLTAYLTQAPVQGGAEGLKKILNPREVLQKDIEVSKTEGSVKSLLSEEGGSLQLDLEKKIHQINSAGDMEITSGCRDCLDSFGIKVQEKIGEGACGVIFDAALEGTNEKYVLKLEKEVSMQSFDQIEGLSFHQRGDLAASCIKKLANMTKPIFVVVALQKEKNSKVEYHYVSAVEAEAFTKKMTSQYPKATVGIAAQLMERASGVELNDAIWGSNNVKTLNFKPSSVHFKNVMNSLFEHLESAVLNNYFHGDIKTENIIYDAKTGRARLIDGGLAAAGTAKLQLEENDRGSELYNSPRILVAEKDHQFYGAEAAAYSIAMTLLHMIDPISFDNIRDSIMNANENFKTALVDNVNIEGIEKKYLTAYGKSAGGRDTKLVQELSKPENRAVRELIDLSFQVSAGGEAGEAAFTTWQNAFHAWQEQEGFSTSTI